MQAWILWNLEKKENHKLKTHRKYHRSFMPLPEKFLHSGRHLAGDREKGAGVTGGGFSASRTDLSPHLPHHLSDTLGNWKQIFRKFYFGRNSSYLPVLPDFFAEIVGLFHIISNLSHRVRALVPSRWSQALLTAVLWEGFWAALLSQAQLLLFRLQNLYFPKVQQTRRAAFGQF